MQLMLLFAQKNEIFDNLKSLPVSTGSHEMQFLVEMPLANRYFYIHRKFQVFMNNHLREKLRTKSLFENFENDVTRKRK